MKNILLKLKNKLLSIWKHDTSQKAWRAFVTTLVALLSVKLGDAIGLLQVIQETGNLDVLKNIELTAVQAFIVSTMAGAVRAALAAIVPLFSKGK